MANVYVSVGSNIEPVPHIRGGLNELQKYYGALLVSSVYESEAVGFVGDNFYNLVIGFETKVDVYTIVETLRTIEDLHGRERRGKSFSARTLDLDLLVYDDLIIQELSIPRTDILKYAFVLLPLSEIAPATKHPVTGRSYVEHWEAFAKGSQPLWRTETKFLQET